MLKLGLTGGIGTGKSTVAAMLVELGVPMLDTDQLARQLTQPGQPALRSIAECFGDEMIDPQGNLRRDLLAARIFGSEKERRQLEAILHPPIRRAWYAQLDEWEREGQRAGCIVIPLLFETGAQAGFDVILCTGCSAATQRRRLLERGWTAGQIECRLAAQLPLKVKMEQSDRVIWTEGAMSTTRRQVEQVLGGLGLAVSGR